MIIQDFTQNLLAHMGLNSASVSVEEQEDLILVQISVSEEDSGLLIGYHGESLAAIQKVLQIIYRKEPEDKKIVVNVNDYKQRRETQLKEMTRNIAQRVGESGKSYIFTYLPANERLIVHQTISEEFPQLESLSSGEGRERRLEVRLKNEPSAE